MSLVDSPYPLNLAVGTARKPRSLSDRFFSLAQGDNALMGRYIGFAALIFAIDLSQRHTLALPFAALFVLIPRHL